MVRHHHYAMHLHCRAFLIHMHRIILGELLTEIAIETLTVTGAIDGRLLLGVRQ